MNQFATLHEAAKKTDMVQKRFLNRYECPCGETWSNEDEVTCDDRCPKCDTSCSPSRSEDVNESAEPADHPFNQMRARKNTAAMSKIAAHYKKDVKDVTNDEIVRYNQRNFKPGDPQLQEATVPSATPLASPAAEGGYSFIVDFVTMRAEEDSFEHGVTGPGREVLQEKNFGTFRTYAELTKAVSDFTGIPMEGATIIDGRISCNGMVDEDNYYRGDDAAWQAKFKAGQVKGYLADVDVYVKLAKVVDKPTDEELAAATGLSIY